MTHTMLRRCRIGLTLALAPLALAGCEDDFLDFSDPDIIEEANSPSGALALKNGVIQRFNEALNGQQGPDALFVYSGLLADEWRSGDTFEQRNQADNRNVPVENTFLAGPLLDLHRVRTQGQMAIRALQEFVPEPTAHVGLVYALTGFVENFAGEVYCNGMPFADIDEARQVIEGTDNSVTSDSAFRRAVTSADLALANAGGAGGDVVTRLASIVKGRALLNLNRPADAAAAVAGVPTDFGYQLFHSDATTTNQIWALNPGARRYVVGDHEGGNGLDFVSAADPRLITSTPTPLAFDSQTPFVALDNYGQFDPVVAAGGIEARLIEAEADLRAGDFVGWLAGLNALRAGFEGGGLAPLADPGSEAGRVDLMFRERAFWMFSTGHRLGDLRRLARQYGRAVESVYPTGAFHKGGNYGTDTALPIALEENNNPNFQGCLDRNP